MVRVAAGIARVGEPSRGASRLTCVAVGVNPTKVADEDSPLLYGVALLVGGGTHVDVVSVVDTAADSVAFDQTIAHDEECESSFEVLEFDNIRRR